MAKLISIEASELLECFQWNDTEYNTDNVLEELADVTNYCLQMAQVLGVDIIEVVNNKMDITEKKYPVDNSNKLGAVSFDNDEVINRTGGNSVNEYVGREDVGSDVILPVWKNELYKRGWVNTPTLPSCCKYS